MTPKSEKHPAAPALDIEHELPPAEETAAASPETAALQAELERVRLERDALLDRLARLQAEFDNSRKRQAREQAEYRDYALVEAIKTLLPILDSFDRALKLPMRRGEEFYNGVELIHKQLHDTLSKLGLVAIEAAPGAEFDPNVHQAIQMVETRETAENHVVDELQRGYKLKDRLLRPAMVRVARKPE